MGALGRTGWLVGRSAECDFPAGVADVPVVTASRVDTSVLSSGDIDAAVRDAVLSGQALYAVDE